MGFLRMLMQPIRVGMMLSAIMAATATATAFPLSLPNCSDSCGGVKIPYPFGQTEGCYLDDSAIFGYYFINCTTNEYGQTQIMIDNLNVTSISIEGEIEIQTYISLDCYDKSGAPLVNNSQTLTLPSFTVSATKNKFLAVGCDTYSNLDGDLDGQPFSIGCISKCSDLRNVVNGSCSGIGCCEMQIPKGLKNVNYTAYSFQKNRTKVWDFNPCSLAFIVQVDKFNFSSVYLTSPRNNITLPMVIDWTIGNETCEVALNKANYICGANTACFDSKSGSGYRCMCRDGYEGNPYLMHGCKDIDECAAKEFNNCTNNEFCVNEPGSYRCSCMEGYHVDGEACVRNNKSSHVQAIIYTGLGTTLALIILTTVTGFLFKAIKKTSETKLRQKLFKKNGGLLLERRLSSNDSNVQNIQLFNSKDLEKATDHFSKSRIVGKGGQGTVFKGMLRDGRTVAIKMCNTVLELNLEQFINEIVILSQINHRNVVKLIGCCLEIETPLLVYEFIPNGTLFQYLHKENEEFPLTWDMRLKIAIEIAGALFYLHSAASSPIFHRDIKSTNILLDEKYRAKVADFGTSKSVTIDQSHVTTLVHGTFGYLDPEYFQTSQFTEKSDVYSFGVVLVELLTGEKPILSTKVDEGRSLSAYFLRSVKENHLFDILDDRVKNKGDKEEIIIVANLAKRCLRLNGKKRPTMREVAIELQGIRKTSNDQQNYEELQFAISEEIEPSSIGFTSTKSCFEIASSSSLTTQPLLPFQSL